jgi:hypothetical protein
MYVHMYVYVHACMRVHMYGRMYVCMQAIFHIRKFMFVGILHIRSMEVYFLTVIEVDIYFSHNLYLKWFIVGTYFCTVDLVGSNFY